MRKVLFVIAMLSLIVSCTSREKKAEKLIKKDLFETLFDYSSYEPVKTDKLDSAFTSIYNDPTVNLNAMMFKDEFERGKELEEKAEDALSDMEIYSFSYSSYSRSKFNKASENAKEYAAQLTESAKRSDSLRNIIINGIKSFNPEFIGYKTVHRFRSKNRAGNYGLMDIEYTFDKDIKNIIHRKEIEDSDEMTVDKLIGMFEKAIDSGEI